jgi:hypothetical protein
MKSGDFVRVTHQCVPKGLVPEKVVVLHYEYKTEGGTKWYALEPDAWELEKLKEMKRIGKYSDIPTIDSHKVYMLKPKQ